MEAKEIREIVKLHLVWRPTCIFLIREINNVQFYGVNDGAKKLRAIAIYDKTSGELEIIE